VRGGAAADLCDEWNLQTFGRSHQSAPHQRRRQARWQHIWSEAGSLPNSNSGFGRVNLADSVVILGQIPNAGCGEGGPLIQSIEDIMTVNIPTMMDTSKAGATLMITLV
jgi:hypothetical protein